MTFQSLAAALLFIVSLAMAGEADAQSFARYLGHYPYERVGRYALIANPRIVARVRAIVPSLRVRGWVLSAPVGVPIVRTHNYIKASGCEQHNCGPHHWSIFVDDTASRVAVCYYEADARRPVRWFGDRMIINAMPNGSTSLCPF